jgi:hypothetical protein
MKRIVVLGIFVLAGITAGWGQAYYEASGQTSVFRLTAGARSEPAAIHPGHLSRAVITSGVNVIHSNSSVVVTLPDVKSGRVAIAIYDIKGRRVHRRDGLTGNSVRLEARLFTPGVYYLLARSGGKSYSRHFAVSR